MSLFEGIFDETKQGKSDFLKSIVNNPIPKSGMSNIDQYKKLDILGEGTFGKVFKAMHIETKGIFAIKQFKSENSSDLFNILIMREIKTLKSLKHENVVELKDYCFSHQYSMNEFTADFYLVFEYCDQDLRKRILSEKEMKFPELKSILIQCLKGVNFIHENNYIHRDLKPANFLLDKNGVVKVADFGWTRSVKFSQYEKKRSYTPNVVTLWYRSPELLLGIESYNQSVDIWSLGCIFIELFVKKPIFRGNNEINQMKFIIKYCGEITNSDWPQGYQYQLKQKPIKNKLEIPQLKQYLSEHIKNSQIEFCIISMLSLNPSNRPSAREIMNNNVFQ